MYLEVAFVVPSIAALFFDVFWGGICGAIHRSVLFRLGEAFVVPSIAAHLFKELQLLLETSAPIVVGLFSFVFLHLCSIHLLSTELFSPSIKAFYPLYSLSLGQNQGDMKNEPVNVNEYQELAKNALPKMYYDYYRGGAEDEFTLKENVKAFSRIMIRPRVLVNVSCINMSTKILGFDISAPILVAPTGSQQLAHPEGEVATARAAAAANTIMVLSFSSSYPIEEIAASCEAVRFYQLYMYKRRDVSEKLVRIAERYGFKAIVLTVDTPKLGRREADIRNRMIAPRLKNVERFISIENNTDNEEKGSNLQSYASQTLDSSLSWKDLAWLKSVTSLPILIKGVLTAEDARKAVEAGAAGIIVSNHGARQLDYSPSSISVLEEVVKAVAGVVPVLLDGGVRRGTDVFKALALGAQAVLIGRPVVFGLAARGEHGVRSVLKMLKEELELTMALAGCTSLKDITRAHVLTERDRLRSLM